MSTPTGVTAERQAATREIGRAVKHSFVYGVGGMLQKAVGFLMLPFYTHYLLPRDYGVLEILNLAMSLLGMFLAMGIPAALLRYYGSAETDEEKRRIVSTAALCVGSTGLIVFAVGCLIIRPASHLLLGPAVPSIYLLLMFGYFVLSYIASVPAAYIRAKEASVALMTVETSGIAVMLFLNIYLIAVLKQSVFGVLMSQLIVSGIMSPALVIWMYRRVGVRVDPILLRKLVSFGAPLILSNVAMFTLNFSDRIFLQHFRSLDVVGVYSVGYKFGYMINFLLIQPFSMMWMARMYQIHRRADHRQIFRQVCILYSLVLVFVGLGFSLFGDEMVRIMADARYASAGQVVPPVVLAYVFLGIGSYLQLGTFLASRTGLIGIVGVVAAVLNVGLNYILIGHFGMIGAAWATALGFLAIAVGSYYCSQRVYPLSLGLGRVLRLLGTAAGVYGLAATVHSHSVWVAVLIKGCLLAGFVVAVWMMRVLHEEEIGTVKALAKSAGAAFIRSTTTLMNRTDAKEVV